MWFRVFANLSNIEVEKVKGPGDSHSDPNYSKYTKYVFLYFWLNVF